MIRSLLLCVLAVYALLTPAAVFADAQPSPSTSDIVDYAKFKTGLTPQHGLFTIWRKEGKVYIELAKSQLDSDFIQTATPTNGLGGFGLTPGLPYIQFPNARIIRFSKVDNKIAVTWPNVSFIAPEGSPAAQAIAQSFAQSVVATAPVTAVDAVTGNVIFDASFLLGDLIDMQDYLRQSLGTTNTPDATYKLDADRTYFGTTKAFPDNVIIVANQTFAASSPNTVDNVTDARALQINMSYSIAAAPPLGSYMPRIADDRIGYYPNIQLDFSTDRTRERQVRYIVRWNLARHPMVYYISNTIPFAYRDPIKKALLTWNQAFARIGIPNAVEVKDQPNDPSWDPDDVRINTVHWLASSNSGGYAQAGTVWDPRTGEILKTSIVIDADLMQFGYLEGTDFTQPVRSFGRPGSFQANEAAYGAGARASAIFGLDALRAMDQIPADQMPPHYAEDFLRAIVLHESGHEWGLQHNFVASEAYTAKQVQSKSFTSKYGLANSVMEYTPTNVWPKGMSNGDYFQTVLGPYDFYAIKWGYAAIAGAKTPAQELPTLRKWASAWSNPWYRFAMDEDVDWGSGHAIDPHVNQFDLTNDNLSWCQSQLQIGRTLTGKIESRFTIYGETHDPLRQAFAMAFSPYGNCARLAWHYIGGEYLSRAHIGDPRAALPLEPVTRAQSQRAFALLDANLFGDSAWQFSPRLLRQLVYSEWVTDLPQPAWAYSPPLRHDVPIATAVEARQRSTLESMFNPVLLQRIGDLSMKYPRGDVMNLTDLFSWTQTSIFRDLRGKHIGSAGEIHRDLQQWYTRKLAQIVLAPAAGTPYDAQSLARAELVSLGGDLRAASRVSGLDTLTHAHIAALQSVVDRALSARTVLPAAP